MSSETVRQIKPLVLEMKNSAPPQGSLSAQLRLDAKRSPSSDSVMISLPNFAARVYRADWMQRRIERLEAALVWIANQSEDAEIVGVANDALRTDWHRENLEAQGGKG